MKVLSINSIVNKYLSFKFLSYILWRIKVDWKLFIGRESTHLITNMLLQTNFENNFLPEIKEIWEWEKRQLISY